MKKIFLSLALTVCVSCQDRPETHVLEVTPQVSDWDLLFAAICQKESRFDVNALGSKGELGIAQFMPLGTRGMLDEANRLAGIYKKDKFTNEDRRFPAKCREAFELIMQHHNPTKSVSKTIKLWNPGAKEEYRNEILSNWELFKSKVEYVKLTSL